MSGCVETADDQIVEIGNASLEPDVNLNESVNEDLKNSSHNGKEESTSLPVQIDANKVPLMDSCNLGGDSVQLEKNKSSNDHNDLAYDSSDDDQPAAVNEVDFSVSKFVSTFANNTVIQNLCWLLKFYKSNAASTNQYIAGILQRICDDLELSPMLYQVKILNEIVFLYNHFQGFVSEMYLSILAAITPHHIL